MNACVFQPANFPRPIQVDRIALVESAFRHSVLCEEPMSTDPAEEVTQIPESRRRARLISFWRARSLRSTASNPIKNRPVLFARFVSMPTLAAVMGGKIIANVPRAISGTLIEFSSSRMDDFNPATGLAD